MRATPPPFFGGRVPQQNSAHDGAAARRRRRRTRRTPARVVHAVAVEPRPLLRDLGGPPREPVVNLARGARRAASRRDDKARGTAQGRGERRRVTRRRGARRHVMRGVSRNNAACFVCQQRRLREACDTTRRDNNASPTRGARAPARERRSSAVRPTSSASSRNLPRHATSILSPSCKATRRTMSSSPARGRVGPRGMPRAANNTQERARWMCGEKRRERGRAARRGRARESTRRLTRRLTAVSSATSKGGGVEEWREPLELLPRRRTIARGHLRVA